MLYSSGGSAIDYGVRRSEGSTVRARTLEIRPITRNGEFVIVIGLHSPYSAYLDTGLQGSGTGTSFDWAVRLAANAVSI